MFLVFSDLFTEELSKIPTAFMVPASYLHSSLMFLSVFINSDTQMNKIMTIVNNDRELNTANEIFDSIYLKFLNHLKLSSVWCK